MTGIVMDIARSHCQGRLALVLEGGYSLDSLARGVHTVLKVLAGATPPEVAECGIVEVAEAAAFHRDAFIEDPEDG
jgi:acetoin utilization deacetylase AcuC-like enzyme